MGLKDTVEAIKGCDGIEFLGEYAQDCPDVCIKVADLRELAEAYERLRESADDVVNSGRVDVEEAIMGLAGVLNASYPRPVELPSAPSGGVLGERES